MFKPNIYLAFEIAMSIRFGFFIVPDTCLYMIKSLWSILPYAIFAVVYPAYASIPAFVCALCVYDGELSNQECINAFVDHSNAHLSMQTIMRSIDHIQTGMDCMLNSTLQFIMNNQ